MRSSKICEMRKPVFGYIKTPFFVFDVKLQPFDNAHANYSGLETKCWI